GLREMVLAGARVNAPAAFKPREELTTAAGAAASTGRGWRGRRRAAPLLDRSLARGRAAPSVAGARRAGRWDTPPRRTASRSHLCRGGERRTAPWAGDGTCRSVPPPAPPPPAGAVFR